VGNAFWPRDLPRDLPQDLPQDLPRAAAL